MKSTDTYRYQLCETCDKATGGCSWSDKFEPVHGWDAIPTTITINCVGVNSYDIRSCPEYVPDKPLTHMSDEGAFNLLQAHLRKSVQEYIWAVQQYEENLAEHGESSSATKAAKIKIKTIERYVLPPRITQTALRLWRSGEYNPDAVPHRTRLSKGD